MPNQHPLFPSCWDLIVQHQIHFLAFPSTEQVEVAVGAADNRYTMLDATASVRMGMHMIVVCIGTAYTTWAVATNHILQIAAVFEDPDEADSMATSSRAVLPAAVLALVPYKNHILNPLQAEALPLPLHLITKLLIPISHHSCSTKSNCSNPT